MVCRIIETTVQATLLQNIVRHRYQITTVCAMTRCCARNEATTNIMNHIWKEPCIISVTFVEFMAQLFCNELWIIIMKHI